MTDDINGGAEAPAESISVPDVPSNTPEPITESTPRGAIDRAFAAVDDDTSEPAPKAGTKAAEPDATEPTGERDRNPDGTFKAKEGAPDTQPAAEPVKADAPATETPEAETPASDVPTRFSPDAKAAWATTPEPVKAEVNRALREMEQGIEKYRGDASVYNDTFKPFVDMARNSNVDPAKTLQSYVAIDQMLAQDFDRGIAQIFENKGASLKEFAAKIVGQPADQSAIAQDRMVNDLRRELADMRNSFAGVQQTVEQQRTQGIAHSLESFTQQLPETDRALFNELDGEIAAYLRDPSTTLADAFAKAKQDATSRYQRMFPASSAPAPAAPVPAPARDAQTIAKGNFSVTGAPSSGSNPSNRKPPSSPRAALDDAFASVGLT